MSISSKNTLLFLINILFLLVSVKFADAQNLGVGIRIGGGASTHINEFKFLVNRDKIKLSPSFTENFDASLIYRKILTNNLRIQVEPGIVRLGASYNETLDNTVDFGGFEITTDSKTNLWHAYMPLLVQLTTTPPDRLEFPKPWGETTYHVTAGIYGSYLLDATFEGTNTGAPLGVQFQGDFTEDVSDQYKDFGAGIILGGGLEHGLDQKLGIEIRGIFGALDSGDSERLNFNPLNLALTFNVYYLF